jgi:hypothetical protein
MPHGRALELWRPRADFDIGYPDSSLAPFDDVGGFGQSFREQLLVVEGIDLTAGMRGGSAGHEGSRALLTGSAFEGRNASIDQFLAVEHGLGSLTPLTSLVLGVGSAETRTTNCISYASGGTPLPKLVDPAETFHEVIGRWQASADPVEEETRLAARRRGRSVLDAVTADLRDLSARLGAAERAKLDAHATALRSLEKKLEGFELDCAVPAPGAPPALDPFSAPFFDGIADLQIDLAAFAMACGVTRFVTLYLNDLSYTGLDPSLPQDIHESVAHRYDETNDGGSWLPLARHNRYSYAKVARLLQRLAEAGRLDSTLVLATSDMGDPARHSSRNVPTVLAGGAALGIRTGRYLDLRAGGSGVPNNRLLVSIARAFGVEIEAYGDTEPEIASGVIDLG